MVLFGTRIEICGSSKTAHLGRLPTFICSKSTLLGLVDSKIPPTNFLTSVGLSTATAKLKLTYRRWNQELGRDFGFIDRNLYDKVIQNRLQIHAVRLICLRHNRRNGIFDIVLYF